MDTPTVELLKTWSKVQFDSLDQPFDDTSLEVVVARANAYFAFVTGRALDATMPADLEPLAQQCVQMRCEQIAYQAQPDYVETGTDDQVASFSAGNYNETRRGPNDRAKANAVMPPVNSWPTLNELLWMVMTDAKRDHWREELGIGAAAFEVSEVDWADYLQFPGTVSSAHFGSDPGQRWG